jgi:SAM-dependent methyltransferase
MKKSITEFFEKIYKDKAFVDQYENPVSLSGPGSFPENNKNYFLFLKEFLNKNNIKSVVDYGCGDFKLYKDFPWNDIKYLGIDVSETAINIANDYSNNNIKFLCKETIDLPEADLLLVKDVFGHWLPDSSTNIDIINGVKKQKEIQLGNYYNLITDFLNINVSKFKYIIIVDNLNGGIEKYFPESFKHNKIKIRFTGKYVEKDKKVYIKE